MEKIHSLENIERKQSHVECFFFFTSKKIQEEKEMKKKKIFENCVEMMRKTLPQGENSFIKFSLSTHTFTSVWDNQSQKSYRIVYVKKRLKGNEERKKRDVHWGLVRWKGKVTKKNFFSTREKDGKMVETDVKSVYDIP